ncbi:MAG: DUF4783 domain-containing protein [Bacteroidetes bacterium]|nr:MAG: DUF4783 domain-containing protein [Bacteroidota bacterium]
MKQFLIALFILPSLVFAQDLAGVNKALGSGDIDALSAYFDNTIELAILEEEGMYNKAQAVQKVRRFLNQNKVQSFTEMHQGASRSSDSQYIIGNLKTSGGTYRVYLYLAKANDKIIIQELRFDSE